MKLLYRLLLIAVALPPILAFYHDLSLYYLKPNGVFKLNPTGYFWAKLDPESLKKAKEVIPEEHWETVNTILMTPGVYVFMAFTFFIYMILSILRKTLFKPKAMEEYDRLAFLRDDKKKGYRYFRKG